jgi:hypothetical protein
MRSHTVAVRVNEREFGKLKNIANDVELSLAAAIRWMIERETALRVLRS